jgi:diadenosine tetraphosphatase ApaH/serine/threonine PP2A family protein phosphatase
LVELKALLDKAQYVPGTDHLVSVGDLFDKGPDQIGVVEYLAQENASCVQGNHDSWFIRWLQAEAKGKNRMQPKADNIALLNALSDKAKKWLVNMPVRLELFGGKILVVHGGPMEGKEQHLRYVDETGKFTPMAEGSLEQPPGTVFWTEKYEGEQLVVYGHHPRKLVEITHNTVGLDTGCVHGNRLSCGIWDGDHQRMPKIVYVEAQMAYEPRPQGLE